MSQRHLPMKTRQTNSEAKHQTTYSIRSRICKSTLVESHSSFSAGALSLTLPPSYFSLKLLSPTLPKLMNWILLSPPPLSSDPDSPPNFGKCTRALSHCSLNEACFGRRAWIIPKRCQPSGSQRSGADHVHVSIFFGGEMAGSEDFASATLPTTPLIFKAKLKIFVTLPS